MTEPFYLTPSRITSALSCGLRYWRQYVKKIEGGKTSCSMFAGSQQHAALEQWGLDQSVGLVDAHREAWFANGPGLLVNGRSGKDAAARRRFSLLGEVLHYRDELTEVEEREANLIRRILTERPELKNVRASKDFKQAAPTLDPNSVHVRLSKADDAIRRWAASDVSPWKPQQKSPLDHYDSGWIALIRFRDWWDSLGDGRPEVLHTEAKERILVGDDAFTITGVIDAVWLWPDGSVEVVDYKRSSGSEDAISHFVQAAVYTLTCEQVVGIRPDRVVFHHLDEGDRLIYEVQPDWTERLVELAERVKRMHDGSDFAPSFRTCSWCDYVQLCREHFAFVPVIEPARLEVAAR